MDQHTTKEVRMNMAQKLALAAIVAIIPLAAAAQPTPTGLWKTIDDDGKTEKSLVRISDSGGTLTGRIEKLLDPNTKPDAVCDKCTDDRKGKPLVGLTILRHLKPDADDPAWWSGGEVVDPKNG